MNQKPRYKVWLFLCRINQIRTLYKLFIVFQNLIFSLLDIKILRFLKRVFFLLPYKNLIVFQNVIFFYLFFKTLKMFLPWYKILSFFKTWFIFECFSKHQKNSCLSMFLSFFKTLEKSYRFSKCKLFIIVFKNVNYF